MLYLSSVAVLIETVSGIRVATLEGVLDRELRVATAQELLACVGYLRTKSELLAIEGQRSSILTENMVLVPALIDQVMNRVCVSNMHFHIFLILVVSLLHVKIVVADGALSRADVLLEREEILR